jgi:hypothetical protein
MSEQTSTPSSVSDLIDRFKSIVAFAASIGCGYEAARQMRNRNTIAPDHWPAVVSAAEAEGIPGVTLEWLSQSRSRHRSRGCA